MSSLLKWALAIAMAAAMLAWPAVINNGPVYFADSVAYLSNGRKLFTTLDHLAGHRTDSAAAATPTPAPVAAGDAPAAGKRRNVLASSSRSPVYGAAVWSGRLAAGDMAGGVAVQALWVAAALLLALRRFGFGSHRARLGAAAVVAVLTSLPFFTAVMMPDAFAGVMMLAIVILMVHGRSLGRAETLFWLANIVIVGLFHMAFVLLAAAVAPLAWLLMRREPGAGRRLGFVLGAAAVAALGMVGMDLATPRLTGTTPSRPPFLLARMIGDGTAEPVLRAKCASAALVACRYLPAMPMTEDQFLWNGTAAVPWLNLTPEDRQALAKEERVIVGAVLMETPLAQVAASAGNVVRQFVTVGIAEFRPTPGLRASMRASGFAAESAAYGHTPVGGDTFPFGPLSLWWQVWYLGGIVASVALIVIHRRTADAERRRIITTALVLLAGLVLSAGITGVTAGVFGRYQGRLSWTAVLAAMMLLNTFAARRKPATD